MDNQNAYQELVDQLRTIYELSSASSVLNWDQQVNMPPEGADLRSRQLSRLSEIIHRRKTDPELREIVESLHEDRANLPFDKRVVVRETRREIENAHKLPSEFVAEQSRASSEAYNVWTEARENDDFDTFLPYLEKNIKLAREEADYLEYDDSRYDPLLDQYDPGLTERRVADLFDQLREQLVPVVEQIEASDRHPPAEEKVHSRTWPQEGLETVGRTLVREIGYNFDAGRIDTTVHPFCSGYLGDVRIATRYNEQDPISSWASLLHEAGHALYEQGLEKETWGTPLSEPVGMSVHESQSRLWENLVGRSAAFWQWAFPKVQETFPEQTDDLSREEFLFVLHRSEPGLIRVEADEVTYNLHIILRFELERDLLKDNIDAEDLPEAWNEKMENLLGRTPPDDRRGVLQDVHWASGAFGYFPSYALGNLLAAQLFDAAREEIGSLKDAFADGNFDPILSWLRSNVHTQGKRYRTDELTERVTGTSLSVDPFLDHVRNSYLPYYE